MDKVIVTVLVSLGEKIVELVKYLLSAKSDKEEKELEVQKEKRKTKKRKEEAELFLSIYKEFDGNLVDPDTLEVGNRSNFTQAKQHENSLRERFEKHEEIKSCVSLNVLCDSLKSLEHIKVTDDAKYLKTYTSFYEEWKKVVKEYQKILRECEEILL